MLFLLLQSLLLADVSAQPPPGPRNKAICPVSGDAIIIISSTPTVNFINDQQLFFSSETAATSYMKSPRDYWLAPHDLPLEGIDGKRGLPDLRNETRRCPFTNETMTISMQTPRVIHKHGQNVYFCCFGCVTSFWTDPSTAIVGTNFQL